MYRAVVFYLEAKSLLLSEQKTRTLRQIETEPVPALKTAASELWRTLEVCESLRDDILDFWIEESKDGVWWESI